MYSAKPTLLTLYMLVIVLFAQTAQSKELMLLNWPDYMDPDIVAEFKKRTGITVKQYYFDSDTARNALLLETGAKGFDIALINDASINLLAQHGWLEPLDQASIPNLKHVDPRRHSELVQTKYFGVPYFWGTVGIAYRKDLVPFSVSSWMDLLQPNEVLHGKISMIGDSRDLISVALKALGYSINSTNIQEIQEAEALLKAQAPSVKTYKYISRGESSALVNGEIAISMMHSSYASMLQKHHDQIAFVIPKEGSNIWIDYISVLSTSNHKAEAKKFINFLNEPEIAARLAQFVHSATPNIDAEALLPAKFKNDPAIYPSKEVLEKSEIYNRQPAKTQKNRAAFISRLVN